MQFNQNVKQPYPSSKSHTHHQNVQQSSDLSNFISFLFLKMVTQFNKF